MDPKLEKYLIRLKGKMDDNESRFTSYIKSGAKLVKIGSGTSKREVNQTVTDYMDEYEVEEGDVFVIIHYGFFYRVFLHGPLIMTCEIKPINDKGKISKKDMLVTNIHYLEDELKTRKWKSNDYKKLFNKLYTNKLKSGAKFLYTAQHLDK
jgi:hypothetical protein